MFMDNADTIAAECFPEIGIPKSNGFYSDIMRECHDIYSGDPPWKKVHRSGLCDRGMRNMSLLNTAKVLCDQFSDMTFGQQVEIIAEDEKTQRFINDVLQKNSFWEKMGQFFTRAYAIGGGAVRAYLNNGEIKLDYISGEYFVPTLITSRGIEEGIFLSRSIRNKSYITKAEYHTHDAHGFVKIMTRTFISDSEHNIGDESTAERREFTYPFRTAVFSYFHPSGANNIADNGLGLSVFWNCRDTLKALDIAFDSLSREFILGRKRIIVPSSCIRTIVDPETGATRRYFDADDEVYQALKCDEENDLKITDNTCELRIEEHKEAINTLLNILCFQTGLSSGTLSFSESSGVRTAAEIESRENRTARTMNSHRNIAAEFIEGIINAVIEMGRFTGQIQGDGSFGISFAKELDTDPDKLCKRYTELYKAGIITLEEAKESLRDIIMRR